MIVKMKTVILLTIRWRLRRVAEIGKRFMQKYTGLEWSACDPGMLDGLSRRMSVWNETIIIILIVEEWHQK